MATVKMPISYLYVYTYTMLKYSLTVIHYANMCGVLRPIHSSQIYKYTNTLTCVPLTCPGLHMEHLHYQGQQAQLATLEGPQIPHLGQWAVELHCPTNAKLPSGEVHMSRSREKT